MYIICEVLKNSGNLMRVFNISKKILLLIFIFISIKATDIQNKHFVIIIPSYNNKYWFQRNLDSVISQNYNNFDVIYIDDASIDKTGELVELYVKERNLEHKIKIIKNETNQGALSNQYFAIHSCNPKDIIIALDADDWLSHENVLTYLNNIYQDPNVWMTYGQYFDYPSGNVGCCRQFPADIIAQNKFREYTWIATHLRSFYAGLFHKINKQDLMYQNKFYPMAGDGAMMYCMLEMSGTHTRFIPEVLYVYNIANQLNDMKVNKALQCMLSDEIKNKEKYQPLTKLFDDE